eukprot:5298394-Karenia_brevis.AAC.1
MIPEFTEEELDLEIRSLRNGKGRDKAGITAELLKSSGRQLKHEILQLFNKVLKMQSEPPESWRASYITVLFKDGDA